MPIPILRAVIVENGHITIEPCFYCKYESHAYWEDCFVGEIHNHSCRNCRQIVTVKIIPINESDWLPNGWFRFAEHLSWHYFIKGKCLCGTHFWNTYRGETRQAYIQSSEYLTFKRITPVSKVCKRCLGEKAPQ